MTFTSNYHSWTIPEVNEEKDVWGAILNTIFEELDEEVIEKGARNDMPQPGQEGRWYLVTDDTPSPSIEYDNGNDWVAVVDGTTGGSTRQEKHDIRSYGATAGGPDCSTAITDAMTAATNDGYPVYIPPGAWFIDSEIVVPEGIEIFGNGYASEIRVDPANTTVNQMLDMDSIADSEIKNVRLNANVANRTGDGTLATACLRIRASQRCLVEDSYIHNFGGADATPAYTGVTISAPDADGVNCEDNEIRGTIIEDENRAAEFGIRMRTDWTIEQQDGAYSSYVRNNTVSGCKVYGTAKSGIEIAGPACVANYVESTTFKNCNAYTSVIEVDFGGHHNVIDNCVVEDATWNGDPEGGSSINGISVDGITGQTYPDRIPHGNRIENCTVRNIGNGGNAGVRVEAYRTLNSNGLTISNCTVENVSGDNDGTERAFTVDSSEKVRIENPDIGDAYRGFAIINSSNAEIWSPSFRGVTDRYSIGTSPRTVIDGYSTNAGDPRSTGAWNGNGYERIVVYDTVNGRTYIYLNGSWEIIGKLWGDEGEYVQLGVSGSGMSGVSTTSTSFTTVLDSPSDNGVLPGGNAKPSGISTYAVSLVGFARNDTAGETTNIRLYDETNATAITGSSASVTSTTMTPFHTTVTDYDPGGEWAFNVELSASSGVAELSGNPAVILWGKIE